MNTIENYIFHLQKFKDSDLDFIKVAVQQVTNLTLPSTSFVGSVSEILESTKLYVPNELSEQDRVAVDQVLYIMTRIMQYYDQTYNSYKENRAAAYPSIGDQLDMIWHSIHNNSLNDQSEFYKIIRSIKDKYPKN